MSALHQRPGGIAYNCDARGYVLGDDCAHADDRTFADHQRPLGRALPDHCPGSDVRMIADVHVAIAVHARRKSDEVGDAAIMRDVRINVGLEAPADAHVRGDRYKAAEHRAFVDHDVVELHDGRMLDAQRLYAECAATLIQPSAHASIANRNHHG